MTDSSAKLLENSKKVYNSYLLLHKLNELKVNNGESLQSVISCAIRENKNQVQFNFQEKQYTLSIAEEDGGYKLKLSGTYNVPEVKDVRDYTNEDIIALWANSEVSLDKGENYAFAIDIYDEYRKQTLKIGGPGKKVPFNLRFANFYEFIKILKNEPTKPPQEKTRLANNIATGSGKTGDIAFFKLTYYLSGIPCITIVPTDILRTQANQFDKEFLPDEVAAEYEKALDKNHNTDYITATFDEALNSNWNVVKDKYSKNNEALICIDEAPTLKQNAVLMARAVELALNNPVAYFSATPDALLSEQFKIRKQILLSPKERSELGIGKSPLVSCHKMKYEDVSNLMVAIDRKKEREHDLTLAWPNAKYAKESENTHNKLPNWSNAVEGFKKNKRDQDINDLFLNLISDTLDSQAYKTSLIATDEGYLNELNRFLQKGELWIEGKERQDIRKKSFVEAVKGLNTGLNSSQITELVNKNINIEVCGNLFRSIKLHSIIDTLNEYKKSEKEFTQDEVSKFIKKKYDISGSFNDELTKSLITLNIYSIDNKHSIERNYTGDKKLHEDIFKNYPKIKDFCEHNVVESYFNKKIKNYNSKGEKTREENSNKEILQMIKAGFVPVTISKDLAIGIDAPRLGSAAVILKDVCSMLDPIFLIQLMGRVGRDASKKGVCYFGFYAHNSGYLNLEDITDLSGKKLLTRLEESRKCYLEDQKSVVEARSNELLYDLKMYVSCGRVNEIIPQETKIFDFLISRIKNEFFEENVLYSYSKKTSIEIFSKVLQKVYDQIENAIIPEFKKKGYAENTVYLNVNPYIFLGKEGIESFKNLYESLGKALNILGKNHITHEDIGANKYFNFPDNSSLQIPIRNVLAYILRVLKNTMSDEIAKNVVPEYSDNMSLEDWAQYIVNAKPMTHDELVNADPNSSAPIFMEQKHISASLTNQQRNQVSSSKPIANVKPQIKINDNNNKVKSNNNTYNNLSAGNTNTPNSTPQFQNNKVSNGITTQQNSSNNNHFKIKEIFPYAALIASLASITCFCCSLPMFGIVCAMIGAICLGVYFAVKVSECIAPAVCKVYNFLNPNSKLEKDILEQNTSSECISLSK